jgi:hypothetical protein
MKTVNSNIAVHIDMASALYVVILEAARCKLFPIGRTKDLEVGRN